MRWVRKFGERVLDDEDVVVSGWKGRGRDPTKPGAMYVPVDEAGRSWNRRCGRRRI